MTSRPHPILALLAAAATTPLRPAAAQVPGDQPRQSVTVEMYADVEAVAPGATFHLAVQYDIIPDWHIYWVNPGDTGYATSLAITAPEGFVVGPVQYPGPHRVELPGNLFSFAYERQVTFIIELKAPGTLISDRNLNLELESDWLVCKEACVMGSATSSLVLRSAASTVDVKPANAQRFAAAAARLPRELKELKIGQPRWRGSKTSPRFEATFPREVELDVFPLLVQDVEAHEPTITRLDDGSSHLTVTFDVNTSRLWPAGPRALAVLRVRRGDEEKYYNLVPEFE